MNESIALFDIYTKAVYDKDEATILSLYDDDVLVFDMWQQWEYKGLAEWKRMVGSWFASLGLNRDVVRFTEIKINESNQLAAATALARFTAVTENDEELRYLESRFTWVMKKREGVWKITHQHSSSPIDFETMKVMLKKGE